MRCLSRLLVAAALLAVAGCTSEERPSPDPIDLTGTGGPDGARPASDTAANTSSSPAVTTSDSTSDITSTPSTSPEERERARAESAVDEALTALRRLPMVTYSSRLSGPGPRPERGRQQQRQQQRRERPDVAVGRMSVVATSSGLVHGGGTVRGERLELVTIDAKLYLRMGPDHWRRLGIDDPTSNRFAFGWTVTSPDDVGFDPRRALRPPALAERLSVEGRGELSYRSRRLPGGKRVYRVDVQGGTMDVSVRAPHRVTTTTVPIWDELTAGGASGNLNLGRRALTTLRETTPAELRQTREVLRGELRGLRTSLLLAPSLRIRVPNVAPLSCSQFGECTITARVTNRVEREFVPATSVQVLLQGFLKARRLGPMRCSGTGLMVVNAATRVSCSVEFAVPSDGRSYEVSGRVLATGFARWEPEPKTIPRQIDRHTTETLRALADR